MDSHRIATLTRTVTGVPSRRDLLRGLTAAGLGLGTLRLPRLVTARQRSTAEAAPKPNKYGCLDVGERCRRDHQCCSGICKPKNGKKRCRAHDRNGCPAEADSCRTGLVTCGTGGYCFGTTGKASFCGAPGGVCTGCTKDVECERDFGPGAACIVCAQCKPIDGRTTACFARVA